MELYRGDAVRMLSLRAFDAGGEMVDVNLIDGREAEAAIARLLADPRAAYLHAHYAQRSRYAAPRGGRA